MKLSIPITRTHMRRHTQTHAHAHAHTHTHTHTHTHAHTQVGLMAKEYYNGGVEHICDLYNI